MTNLPIAPIPGAILTLDFSSNNETDQLQIDWPTLAAAILPVYPDCIIIVKMAQGTWYLNPYRHRQRWGAHAAGFLHVGLYSYLEFVSQGGPNIGQNVSGADNANFLIKVVGDDGGIVKGEFYAIDVEAIEGISPTADLDAAVIDCEGTIQRADGISALFYSADWFAKPHNLERDPKLAAFRLWWASFQPALPPIPEPWASAGKGIDCWQKEQATLPGVPFPVDISWWLTGLATLRMIQWGFAPDPLGGQLIAGTPDVPINDKGEAVDAGKTFQTIAGNLERARRLYGTRSNPLDDLLATTQGDAAAGALISGLLS